MSTTMYKLSRYWNRGAYFILRLGQKMIWDQTGRNGDLLKNDDVARKYTEDIMCTK